MMFRASYSVAVPTLNTCQTGTIFSKNDFRRKTSRQETICRKFIEQREAPRSIRVPALGAARTNPLETCIRLRRA